MTNTKDRITSKANPTVKALCKLSDEPTPERFLIEGKHLVDMAFEAGCLLEVYSINDVEYGGVPVTLVSDEVLRKIAVSPSPSGIVGVAHKPDIQDSGDKALFLDRVQDPGNVGTILRSALAFGYKTIYLSEGCASPFSNKAIAASQGAIFGLKILEIRGDSAVKTVQNDGYFVIASSLRDAVPLGELKLLNKPFCLIMGNEGRGIRDAYLKDADIKTRIEMDGIESLNVGVAAGILMYNLNQR
jgi:TrmH family RNA methyltransferase